MKFADTTVNSIGDMLTALNAQAGSKQLRWFRGHARFEWSLVPSLARKEKYLKAESALIKRFIQNGTPFITTHPREEYEWMFLMQHHRALTRLLDWSESPLVALYFAVQEKKHYKRDGVVWCLNPVELNKAANLSFDFGTEIPAFGRDKVVDSYLPTHVNEGSSALSPIAIVGPRNTARMAAQLGVFTINHRIHTSIDAIGTGSHVWRWRIPSASKKNILMELSHLGISALTLFPELDQVAELSKEILI